MCSPLNVQYQTCKESHKSVRYIFCTLFQRFLEANMVGFMGLKVAILKRKPNIMCLLKKSILRSEKNEHTGESKVITICCLWKKRHFICQKWWAANQTTAMLNIKCDRMAVNDQWLPITCWAWCFIPRWSSEHYTAIGYAA